MEVLGWVRSAGVQMAILWPLYFLTGALNGMEGSTLGGIVGKTLLLVLLNSFIKGVVIQTRGQGGRRRNFWNQFKANASNALLTRIPQFFNMKNCGTPDRSRRWAAACWGWRRRWPTGRSARAASWPPPMPGPMKRPPPPGILCAARRGIRSWAAARWRNDGRNIPLQKKKRGALRSALFHCAQSENRSSR